MMNEEKATNTRAHGSFDIYFSLHFPFKTCNVKKKIMWFSSIKQFLYNQRSYEFSTQMIELRVMTKRRTRLFYHLK